MKDKFEKETVLPCKRLVVGSPVYTIKVCQMGHTRPLVACAGERGKVIICDYSKECTQDQGDIHFYKRMYFKDFPSTHMETKPDSQCGILNFDQKIDAHEYSIFDVEWVQGQKYIATASSDLTSKVICVETGKTIAMQRGKHEASIKCIKQVDLSGNVLVSGGRDGKIAVFDIREPNAGSEYSFNQQVFKCKGQNLIRKRVSNFGLSKPSITGISVYGDDQDSPYILTSESTSNTLTLFDMRMVLDQIDQKQKVCMNKSLVCQIEPKKFYQSFYGEDVKNTWSGNAGIASMVKHKNQLGIVNLNNTL